LYLSPAGTLAGSFRLVPPTPRHDIPDTVALTPAEIRQIVLDLLG